jgi:transposase-like protein
LIGENGLIKQLTKMLVERALEKNQTRWAGFDDKIISLYTRGLSVGGE